MALIAKCFSAICHGVAWLSSITINYTVKFYSLLGQLCYLKQKWKSDKTKSILPYNVVKATLLKTKLIYKH